MNRAVCMAWHRYHPHQGQYYRAIWEFWLKRLPMWKHTFDKLYLVDDFFDFMPKDTKRLEEMGINFEIIPQEKEGHHWVQFKTAMPYIKERYCLYLDNDVVIYGPEVIEEWFENAEQGLFVTAFDGSGGLKDQMQAKFPWLKDCGAMSLMKGECQRMGSYYYILDKEVVNLETIPNFDLSPKQPYKVGTVIPGLDYVTKEGDWSDSYGYFSPQIFSLYDKYYEIPDWRGSWLLNIADDGFLQIFSNGPEVKDKGYYHLRNGNLGCYLLTVRKYDNDAYKECLRISAPYEARRLLAWFDIHSEGLYHDEVLEVAKDLGVIPEIWEDYLVTFKEYHGL